MLSVSVIYTTAYTSSVHSRSCALNTKHNLIIATLNIPPVVEDNNARMLIPFHSQASMLSFQIVDSTVEVDKVISSCTFAGFRISLLATMRVGGTSETQVVIKA